MTLLAAYAALLHRYSGQDDLVIGSPFACRDQAGLIGLVGYLANPVALRADLHDDPTFMSLLGRVKDTVLGALAHQDYPFPLLVERLRPVRDAGRTPLFQVSFAWEQTRRFPAEPARTDGGLHLETVHIGQGGAPFDLMMQMGEQDGTLPARCSTTPTCSTPRRSSGWPDTSPRCSTASSPIPTGACRSCRCSPRTNAANWRPGTKPESTTTPPPACTTWWRRRLRRVPDAVAVTCEDRELTYAELDRRADALAHRLQRLGVGPDVIVPVLLDRSEDLVVALLGVLKAGGAFLPLDPAQPTHRMATILADAPDAPVCVTHQRHLATVPTEFTGHRLCLDLPSTPAAGDAVVTAGRRRRPTSPTSSTRPAPPVRRRARSTPTAESATGCCGCRTPTR